MKPALLFLFAFGFVVPSDAGQVQFANTSTALLNINRCIGGPDGVTTGARQ